MKDKVKVVEKTMPDGAFRIEVWQVNDNTGAEYLIGAANLSFEVQRPLLMGHENPPVDIPAEMRRWARAKKAEAEKHIDSLG